MYCYDGIVYRILAVSGIMFLLGILCILFEKPWSDTFRMRNCIVGILLLVFSILSGIFYLTRIAFPHVLYYEGEYVEENRNSRAAPPLPLTYEYVFSNENDEKNQVFYLDVISCNKMIPSGFSSKQTYRIYYDEPTRGIVEILNCTS